MDGDPAVRLLFAADGLALGEFHCWPDDPRWSQENRAEEGHFVVFPGTSVVIEHSGRPVVATPNHVMFYNRNQAYRRRLLHPRGDHCAFLLVEERRLAEAAGGDGPGFRFPVSHGPVEPGTYLLHRLVLRAACTVGGDGLLVEETLCRLLREALAGGLRLATTPERPGRATTAGSHAELVEATKELVAGRLGDRLTLGEIARSVHSSPFHLARVFRVRTGFTIHGYRNQLRLRSALDGLFEADADLSLVARRLGYSSHSHFTDSFRRAFGRTPSSVRRAGRTGGAELRRILEAPLAAAS
ncbi:MAG: helix-turn-helix transcriptional regulator [Gaiellaceae bacterium]